MKFLDLDGLNTLKGYIKDNYLSPKIITSDQLDTCGYENTTELIKAAENSKHGLMFYVSNIYSTLCVYAYGLKHGCVQVLTGTYILDKNNPGIGSHRDGQSTTYVRTYLNNPDLVYNSNAGFDRNTQAWSAWVIRETDVATNNESANSINSFREHYGNLINTSIVEITDKTNSSKKKLALSEFYTGGTQVVPLGSISKEIPEASSTCNGLMSVADKIKLDGLSGDGGSSTPTDPTSVSKIVRFKEVVTDDVTLVDGSAVGDNQALVYLDTKKIFAVKNLNNNTYYANGSLLMNNYPGVLVGQEDIQGPVLLNFTAGYKPTPNAIYVDETYKMYVGDGLGSLKSGGTFCNSLNVINVNKINDSDINV